MTRNAHLRARLRAPHAPDRNRFRAGRHRHRRSHRVADGHHQSVRRPARRPQRPTPADELRLRRHAPRPVPGLAVAGISGRPGDRHPGRNGRQPECDPVRRALRPRRFRDRQVPAFKRHRPDPGVGDAARRRLRRRSSRRRRPTTPTGTCRSSCSYSANPSSTRSTRVSLLRTENEVPAEIGILIPPPVNGLPTIRQKIKIEPDVGSDLKLRTTMMHPVAHTLQTGAGTVDDPIVNTFLRVNYMDIKFWGKLPNGNDFMTNPTSCQKWETRIDACGHYQARTPTPTRCAADRRSSRRRRSRRSRPTAPTRRRCRSRSTASRRSAPTPRDVSPDFDFTITNPGVQANGQVTTSPRTIVTQVPASINVDVQQLSRVCEASSSAKDVRSRHPRRHGRDRNAADRRGPDGRRLPRARRRPRAARPGHAPPRRDPLHAARAKRVHRRSQQQDRDDLQRHPADRLLQADRPPLRRTEGLAANARLPDLQQAAEDGKFTYALHRLGRPVGHQRDRPRRRQLLRHPEAAPFQVRLPRCCDSSRPTRRARDQDVRLTSTASASRWRVACRSSSAWA